MKLIKVIVEAIKQYRKERKEAIRRKHIQLDEEAIRRFIQEEVKAEFERNHIISTRDQTHPTFRELYMKRITGDNK
jgi:hypothetical protein